MQKALILTNGLLAHPDAKTAHGLIRGSERFEIVGVIDPPTAGQDAGVVLDGQARQIPVVASWEQALRLGLRIDCCIIGVATTGGYLPESLRSLVHEAVGAGISVINGLHEFLNEDPTLRALALQTGAELIDVRRPKPKSQLHFWSGKIHDVTSPIVAVLGTDCAVGKRTTARLVQRACAELNLRVEMIYTGQTGWMQGSRYGFVLDATLNDFVSGELEHAITQCYQEVQPDLILLEGQSALFNPSGPCGAEYLLSGKAKHVILVHAPKRQYFEHEPHWGAIPPVAQYLKLIELYGSSVVAIALNTEGCSPEEALDFQASLHQQTGLPVVLPLEQGVAPIAQLLHQLVRPVAV
jgi:uncharacterized NAD-dependent epimerase/dehydratase family protein